MRETTTLPWHDLPKRALSQWTSLVRELSLNPSCLPDWLAVSLSSHARLDHLQVCISSEDDRLVAVLPFFETRERILGVPVRIITSATDVVSNHAQVMAADGGRDIVRHLLHDRRRGSWDVFRMSNVPVKSVTRTALEELAAAEGWPMAARPGDNSPYLPISGTWDSYLRSQTKKFRANVTRYLRKIDEYGPTGMTWFRAHSDTTPLLQAIIAIEDRSWKKGAGHAIKDRPFELEYHRQLLPYLSASGMLLANVLSDKGTPLAYVLCALHGDWCGQLKTSFVSATSDAGAATITASVMQSYELGIKEYDFLGAADRHKMAWTEFTRPHEHLTVYSSTPTGRALGLANRVNHRLRRTSSEGSL